MPSAERPELSSSPSLAPERTPHHSPAVSEALARLELAVAEIHDSDTFRAYLAAQARFHHYSWGNVLLILSHRPDATHVAGYRTWQSLGRSVRRGERGIRIVVPLRPSNPQPVDDSEDGETGIDTHRSWMHYGTGVVFDITQTEGAPLPNVEVPVLEGEGDRTLYGRLEEVARSEGLPVDWVGDDELNEGTMGYYHPKERRIALREASPLQMTKTLAHELAHYFNEAECSSAAEETRAEAIAYVVCSHFGMDTGARSFPYVAVWSREPRFLKRVLGQVQRISSLMIDRIEASGGPTPASERTDAGG